MKLGLGYVRVSECLHLYIISTLYSLKLNESDHKPRCLMDITNLKYPKESPRFPFRYDPPCLLSQENGSRWTRQNPEIILEPSFLKFLTSNPSESMSNLPKKQFFDCHRLYCCFRYHSSDLLQYVSTASGNISWANGSPATFISSPFSYKQMSFLNKWDSVLSPLKLFNAFPLHGRT